MSDNKRISRNIKNLFLDPNNYRFIDKDEHQHIEDDSITDKRIQQRTMGFVEGHKRDNIADLIASFKANGFLDVDIIQLRDLGDNNYLVLEGNRRVTALKRLQQDYENGLDIGKLSPEIFKRVPSEIHENEDNEKHLIIMGLKHISGNKKWGTFNQDKLIYDFLSPYLDGEGRVSFSAKEKELMASLGITKTRLRTRFRVFNLMLAYKNSEYGDQFNTDKYACFDEIVRKPVIKTWLDWNDGLFKANNEQHLHRLFAWLSKTNEFDEQEEELTEDEDDGYFRDYEDREPIITKAREIRDLALFIHQESALTVMEQTGSITQGLLASGAADKNNYEAALSKLDDNVTTLGRYADLVANGDIEKIKRVITKLNDVVPNLSRINIESGNYQTAFEYGKVSHFSEIDVQNYKGIKGFKFDKLNRINILAGLNNCGKTSLLEAIFLLTRQNDIGSFFKLLELKNKTQSISAAWLNKTFDSTVGISGCFDGVNTNIKLSKFDAQSIDKKDDYIASYQLTSCIENTQLKSTIHTFLNSPLSRDSEEIKRLCHSTIKSPYFHNFDAILYEHNKTVEAKTDSGISALNEVVVFLKSIDSQINDVNLTEDAGLRRFIVDSQQFEDKDVDITSYGEGVQRIFYIALAFAASRNGVVCIDEFETAIHYSLLVKFSKFVQQLAQKFNVQVFLTTHSKECVDAFLANNYRTEDITGFRLINTNGVLSKKVAMGQRFKTLNDSINLDIRGDHNE